MVAAALGGPCTAGTRLQALSLGICSIGRYVARLTPFTVWSPPFAPSARPSHPHQPQCVAHEQPSHGINPPMQQRPVKGLRAQVLPKGSLAQHQIPPQPRFSDPPPPNGSALDTKAEPISCVLFSVFMILSRRDPHSALQLPAAGAGAGGRALRWPRTGQPGAPHQLPPGVTWLPPWGNSRPPIPRARHRCGQRQRLALGSLRRPACLPAGTLTVSRQHLSTSSSGTWSLPVLQQQALCSWSQARGCRTSACQQFGM